MRVEAEHRAATQLGGPLLHGADVQVAVLDRPRKAPFLERRPHPRALVERHGAAKHERLRAAAYPRPYSPHDDVARPRLGQAGGTDLAATGLSQPERLCDSVLGAHAAVVLACLSHDRVVSKYAGASSAD